MRIRPPKKMNLGGGTLIPPFFCSSPKTIHHRPSRRWTVMKIRPWGVIMGGINDGVLGIPFRARRNMLERKRWQTGQNIEILSMCLNVGKWPFSNKAKQGGCRSRVPPPGSHLDYKPCSRPAAVWIVPRGTPGPPPKKRSVSFSLLALRTIFLRVFFA